MRGSIDTEPGRGATAKTSCPRRLEALSAEWRGRRLDLDELNWIVKQLRVQRVMQPYLRAIAR